MRHFEYFSPSQRVFDRPRLSTGWRIDSPNKGISHIDLKCGLITLSKGAGKKDETWECHDDYVFQGSHLSDASRGDALA
jgi:hypothetical protein